MSHAAQIDKLMERASALLEATNYLPCEAACVQALELARQDGDYDRIARIMMPLQEARRQRRQIAEDAGVFVLTGHHRKPEEILDKHPAGCLLLTDPPYTAEDEQALRALARQRNCFVEIQRMDRCELRSAFLAGLEQRGDALLARIDVDKIMGGF